MGRPGLGGIYRGARLIDIARQEGAELVLAGKCPNHAEFGLGAGVWTSNMRLALKMSERLEASSIWVNTFREISYTTPFGAYKKSGIGRENGVGGIFEYLQTKAVWLSTAEQIAHRFVIG